MTFADMTTAGHGLLVPLVGILVSALVIGYAVAFSKVARGDKDQDDD